MISHYLPFLPSSLRLPFFGVVTGDGVAYVILGALLLIVLLIVIVVAMLRGSSARARMGDRALYNTTQSNRVTTGSARTINTTLQGRVVRGSNVGGTSYRTALDNIGVHLASLEAQHILVSEVEGGYLLLYHDARNEPIVETLTTEEIAGLARPSGKQRGNPSPVLRQELAEIGRFLDQQVAISAFVSHQQGGYYVEYATTPTGAHSASKLVRVSRVMDDDALKRLALR